MSKPHGGWIVDPKHIDETILAVISAEFDAETDAEEAKYFKKKAMETHLKKMCILRIIASPIDLTVGTAIFGLEFGKKRLRMVTDMVKFVFKRMSAKQVLKSIDDNI